jgi:hypothetical protein
MPLVPIEQVLQHLRADAGGEDELVALYLSAAEQAAADYLNRQVFDSATSLAAAVAAGTAGLDPLVVNGAVLAAILLITGHLYANREEVVVGATVAQMPFAAQSLLRPHRRFPGF